MVGVACKTDKNHQVVVNAMIQLAIGRPFDGSDMLQAFLTALLIGLFGDFHIRLKSNLSRVNTVDAVRGSDNLTLAPAHGIAVVTVFTLDDGVAVGIVQVVVEFITRGITMDYLAVGLGELDFDIPQRR